MSPSSRPTKALIDLEALTANLATFRSTVGKDVEVMAVVKADAYGHGAVQCAAALAEAGVSHFAVALPEEAVELRNADLTGQIVTFGGIWPGQEEIVSEYNVVPVVSSIDQVERLERHLSGEGRRFPIHLKIDTGMGRAGFRADGLHDLLSALERTHTLAVDGVMTHFAQSENADGDEFTAVQTQLFYDAVEAIRQAGHEPELIDLANSPAALRHPGSYGNMVRIGGGLYGILDDIMPDSSIALDLQPVMELRTAVTLTKPLERLESVGYGRSFVAERDMMLALLPIGYADGLPRQLSNVGHVVINGKVAPIIGRISMDWTVVDVTDHDNVSVGDEVVVIGSSGDEKITAGEIGGLCGTIGYDITCGIAARVPRIYKGG
jgi:alanine racemase